MLLKLFVSILLAGAAVNAAQEEAPLLDGEKHNTFTLDQLFMLRQNPRLLVQSNDFIMDSPPKEIRLPIPTIEAQSTLTNSTGQKEFDYYEADEQQQQLMAASQIAPKPIIAPEPIISGLQQDEGFGLGQTVPITVPESESIQVDNINGSIPLLDIPEEDVIFIVNNPAATVSDSFLSGTNSSIVGQIGVPATLLTNENDDITEIKESFDSKGIIEAKQSFQKKTKPASMAVNNLKDNFDIIENPKPVEKPIIFTPIEEISLDKDSLSKELVDRTETIHSDNVLPIQIENNTKKIVSAETDKDDTVKLTPFESLKQLQYRNLSTIPDLMPIPIVSKEVNAEAKHSVEPIVDSDVFYDDKDKEERASKPETPSPSDLTLPNSKNVETTLIKETEAPISTNIDAKPKINLDGSSVGDLLKQPVPATRVFIN